MDSISICVKDPAEARVAAVAGALLVLADADLRAFDGTQDLRTHLHVPGIEHGIAVAAHEQDGRRDRRAVLLGESVHQQTLALTDAVLLSGNLDDRVGHVVDRCRWAILPAERRGRGAREPGMIPDARRFRA